MDDLDEKGRPGHCFGVLPTTKQVILIKRGERGYWPFKGGIYKGHAQAAELNKEIGVTPAQQKAMECGSLFGWEAPAADPAEWKAFVPE